LSIETSKEIRAQLVVGIQVWTRQYGTEISNDGHAFFVQVLDVCLGLAGAGLEQGLEQEQEAPHNPLFLRYYNNSLLAALGVELLGLLTN
jgi:hypothetical protein